MRKVIALTDKKVIDKIFLARGKKVMLDRDLAEMYGVETRILNQAVKRNAKRFPEDFMFQLSEDEFQNLISQIVTSSPAESKSWGGVRKMPFAFSEQGVAMLSSVLNSNTAIEVNIQIIRIFTRLREELINNKEVLLKLEKLEKQVLEHDHQLGKHVNEIQVIFNAMKNLLITKVKPRRKIGFKLKNQ